ncbi:MAG TPA: DUF2868 domain-containing protein, partial [Phycisphaeraceae bacterium]|nr:DUF2868 domain-containing protein [Phycisphaeraceae bacterium]
MVNRPADISQNRPKLTGRITLPDRLLAEAVRAYETGQPIHHQPDEQLLRTVMEHDGDMERRLVNRAALLPTAADLRKALGHVRSAFALALLASLLSATIAGAGAAGAALASPGASVNFFRVLFGLLGFQTLLLIAWLVLLLLGPRLAAAGSLGRIVTLLARYLAGKLHRGRTQQAALAATAAVYARGRIARWGFSTISHALWLVFNAACIVVLVALLSSREYNFSWETTILSEPQYQKLTAAIAYLPRQVGFDVPSEEDVRASRHKTAPSVNNPAGDAAGNHAAPSDPAEYSPEVQRKWAQLLVGSLIVYALIPRLLLLFFSLLMLTLARRKYRLDTTMPGFARLRPLLMPGEQKMPARTETPHVESETEDVVDTPDQTELPQRPTGNPALVGLEIDPPATGWPPSLPRVTVNDLGIVEDGEDRRYVLELLRNGTTQPASLLLICDLTTTPDRGLETFIAGVRNSISTPVFVVLSAGQRLRHRQQREDAVTQRLSDWQKLLKNAGIDKQHIIELDLDHLTAEGKKRLARCLGADLADTTETARGPVQEHERHLEPAFDMVRKYAEKWLAKNTEPDMKEQAELQQAINELYGDREPAWKKVLDLPQHLPDLKPAEMSLHFKTGAERMLDLMPARLKKSPKWLVAGATTGALACVSAGVFAAPVVLAS